MSETSLISVGYHKGEMDFGVNGDIRDLTHEQMNELRIMTMVAIGQAEEMWSRKNEARHPGYENNTSKTYGL